MNLNVKLFTSYNNSNIISAYNKFNNNNPNLLLKSNCNSNSLFQLNNTQYCFNVNALFTSICVINPLPILSSPKLNIGFMFWIIKG